MEKQLEEEVEGGESGEGFGVVCISDIHFGAVSSKSLEALMATIESEPSVKVIVFAGDITQFSLPEEYTLASLFFDELIARGKILVNLLFLPPPHTTTHPKHHTKVATPGNHDFGGGVAEMASRVPGLRDWSTGYPAARGQLSAMFEGSIFPQSAVLARHEYDSITRYAFFWFGGAESLLTNQ